jgi:DNA gyrase inhibitor GyrI
VSFTNTFETTALKWVFTTDSVTRPTSWYIGLFTDNPGETGAGTEVSGFDYARTSATFAVTGNTASNDGAVEFPVANGGNWGTITHIGIHDAATAGNMIAYAELDVAKAINDGDVFRIPDGDLDVTLD